MPRAASVLGLAALCLAASAAVVRAQTSANVLVVANEASPASLTIAGRYLDRRGIPADQLVRIKTSTVDEISRADFEAKIQGPIADWLSKNAAQDRILYIVLTKGVPLRIQGTMGRSGTVASVDSELTLLYRRMAGALVVPNGSQPNPYFLGTAPLDRVTRFSHVSHDIYLVTRLDGYTVDDVLGLIERGASPVQKGRVALDQRASLSDKGNEWLAGAAAALKAQGFGDRVVLDDTSRALLHEEDLLGYYSWGSNDPALVDTRPLGLKFVAGAVGSMFVSTDARTFVEPPAAWKPGRWETAQAYFAGTPQSLTGDLVRAGITGVSGNVAEPFLDSAVRPDILFAAYFSGLNLAEAFYLAMPTLSWQTVVLGDPLCSPFTRPALSEADANPALEETMLLPGYFAVRRLATQYSTAKPDAAKLVVRAEALAARDDTAGAVESLERAVRIDDSIDAAWRTLALLYEKVDPPKAAPIYRKLVARNPKDAVSLNNLAYSLAVHEQKPAEALSLAERALMLQPHSAVILDTVGWVRHLAGDDAAALRALLPAAAAAPNNGEVQLHAAQVLAAIGRLDDAAKYLKAAEAADPAVKETPEFALVLSRIRGGARE
jgi:uncharacterized protein (TIGR03790 family)